MNELTKGVATLTKKTFNRMRYRAMRGKLGMSSPQWTLPREIGRILFMSDKLTKSKRGDLHPESTPPAPRALSTTLSVLCYPTSGCLCFVSAPRGILSRCLRLIHALCPFGKDLMREVF